MAGSTRQFVTFVMGEELYGIDIFNTQEIIRIPEITPIPNSLEYVEGIINLRGDIIPVINLEKRFHMVGGQSKKELIIIRSHNTKLGIVVNKVFRVVQVEGKDVSPPPSILSGIEEEYIQGVTRLEDNRLVILLDVEKMFFEEEIENLKQLGG
jgi:purine-binding chemotaxis protein CheW